MKRETFTARDGKIISTAVWDETENPKGVIIIAHGMAEHIARYADFAAAANAAGFIVAGEDHRAHGLTDPDSLGVCTEPDVFESTVSDIAEYIAALESRYSLPIVAFGFGYGAFLLQRYISENSDKLAGCILCGSALIPRFKASVVKKIAAGKLKKHRDAPAETLSGMTFKSYDRRFKPEGINAWLSRDVASVGKYNVDPLCGFTCYYGFYYSVFKGVLLTNGARASRPHSDFKLLLVSGDSDGAGKNGKLVKKLFERYKSFGLSPRLKLYAGARHELFHETNRGEVFAFVLDFALSAVV